MLGMFEDLEELVAAEAVERPTRAQRAQLLPEEAPELLPPLLRGTLPWVDLVRDLVDLDPAHAALDEELHESAAIEGDLYRERERLDERGGSSSIVVPLTKRSTCTLRAWRCGAMRVRTARCVAAASPIRTPSLMIA